MKSLVITAALLLLPAAATAQDAAPAAAPAAAPVPAAPKPKRAVVAKPAPAVAPAQATPDVLDLNQIIGIRQVDPATYEIDARLQSGGEVHLRMNAFVMQNLGQRLGTYGK